MNFLEKYRDYDRERLIARLKELEAEENPDSLEELQAINELLSSAEERGKKFGHFCETTARSFDSSTVFNTPEYRSAFFKNILGQSLTDNEQQAMAVSRIERRSEAFNTAGNSSAVLPTKTLDEIISKARGARGLISECRLFSVPAKLSIPIATPSSRAAWHAEGAEVETEATSVNSVVFDMFELIKIFSLSLKVKQSSVAGFEAYLSNELKASLFDTLDYTLINGSGGDEPRGLLCSISEENTVNCLNSISYSDIITGMAKLKRGYSNGAKFLMNSATLFTQFYTALDGISRPIFVNNPQSDFIGAILGYPVVLDDNMPDNTVLIGNFSSYLGVNIPQGVLIETSRDSAFRRGLIDIRAVMLADCKPLIPEAFAKIAVGANG